MSMEDPTRTPTLEDFGISAATLAVLEGRPPPTNTAGREGCGQEEGSGLACSGVIVLIEDGHIARFAGTADAPRAAYSAVPDIEVNLDDSLDITAYG